MGFWPMVPFYEMVVPGLNRAYVFFYANWAAYDQLRLRLALDAYRRDHGALDAWPLRRCAAARGRPN